MKSKIDEQSDRGVSDVLARLKIIRARGKREALIIDTRLSALRSKGIITPEQFNKVMGIRTE